MKKIPIETRTCRCGQTFECKVTSKRRVCVSGHWSLGLTKETHKGIKLHADNLTGRTKENNEGVRRRTEKLRGRTKENHEGIKRTSKKLKGRTKETHEGIKQRSKKITGRTKETHEGIRRQAKKLTGRKHLASCNCFCCKAKRGEYKGKNNPNYGTHLSSEQKIKMYKGQKRRPNKPEKQLDNIIKKYSLPFKYTGDGKFWIRKGKLSMNPDWVNTNHEKIALEMFGDYWHNLPRVIKKDAEKLKILNEYGWKLIVIWQHELKELSEKEIVQKILE